MSGTTPPTIVIIHGAFHQAAHFIEFDAALQEIGLKEVRIPQLPSASHTPPQDAFAADVAVVRKTILSCLTSGRDVMVVAHSYGGKPLTDALADVPHSTSRDHVKVLGIVYVAAGVYEEGELSMAKEGKLPGVKKEGDTLVVDSPDIFFNTLTDQAAKERAISLIVPTSINAATEPVKTASWSQYPCAYVQCLQDKALPLDDQEHNIAKLKRRCKWDPAVAKLNCDHDSFLSEPEKLAQLVKTLVDDALESQLRTKCC